MYLFFDTETTGLPKRWNASITETEVWPRMVQIAWMQCNHKGEVVDCKSYIIRPEGFTIPKEASDIHKITTERALEEGVNLKEVLNEFYEKMNNSRVLIAHNMSYDEKIVGAEFIRNETDLTPLRDIRKICTKEGSTNFCKIPGGRGYKWPKLEELHQKLFNCNFDNAHDALSDVKATMKCFFALKDKGIIQ